METIIDKMMCKVDCIFKIWYLSEWVIGVEELKNAKKTEADDFQFILFNITKRDALEVRLNLIDIGER